MADDVTRDSTSATPLADVKVEDPSKVDTKGSLGGRTNSQGEAATPPLGDNPSKAEVQQAEKDAAQAKALGDVRSDLLQAPGHTANLAIWENSPEGKQWLAAEGERQKAIEAEDKRLAEARDAAEKTAAEQTKHLASTTSE